MADKRPVQHTPAHVGNVVDARHPAASSFAPLQPGAGVVADDVPDEQNPGKGIKASRAEKEHKGLPDELRKRNAEVEATTVPAARIVDGEAKPAEPAKSTKK